MTDDMAGDCPGPRTLEIDKALASLLIEVRDAGVQDDPLDCGDLFAACLLDHFACQLVASWSERAIERSAILRVNRMRIRQGDIEGGRQIWHLSGIDLHLTAWASFVLRFLPACGYADFQQLILMSGLCELAPPSVVALLDALGLDGSRVARHLAQRTYVMRPLSRDTDQPHRVATEERFVQWLVREEMSEGIAFDAMDSDDHRLDAMLCWLEGAYAEMDPATPLQEGDVALHIDHDIRDLAVLDKGRVWRSLTSLRAGSAISSAECLTRLFRPRGKPRISGLIDEP
ncbi:MAG: hypothetical protein JXA69_07015 [Phycisphaerae bacterium]|nr:hypothetical protein [Phycisphaerae bacterium]